MQKYTGALWRFGRLLTGVLAAAGVVAARAAGGETAEHDGGGCETDETAFDPGFHDGAPFRKLLNMTVMVPAHSLPRVSAR